MVPSYYAYLLAHMQLREETRASFHFLATIIQFCAKDGLDLSAFVIINGELVLA